MQTQGRLTAIILIVVLAFPILAACGGDSCGKDKYMEKVESIIEKWDDAIEIAGSTARMSLPPQIERLQEIRREADDVKVSECEEQAHDRLLSSMDYFIQGYIAFLGQEDSETVNRYFGLGADHIQDFTKYVSEIGE